jgi:Mn2+/Fe2+ NRAMP family transporter
MPSDNRIMTLIGPGLLVAATGVGAGDLATAAFAGSRLGTTVLWAVIIGGLFKFVLTEGLARWQLVTRETFLAGVANRFGPIAGWLFLPYMFLWTFFVGSALMSACGVTLHALLPVFNNPFTGKVVFGIISSLTGLSLVLYGGFSLFEKVMGICIGVMFCIVIITAVLLWPGFGKVFPGMFIPVIPDIGGSGVAWVTALIGGVGGTLTILCYGYWIREEGRQGPEDLKTCRLDLGLGYAMTILFGLAMVIIGSTVEIHGRGAGLLVVLADQLGAHLGPVGRLLFLIGALSAVFSSLLGVWQAVPYLFADIWRLFLKRNPLRSNSTTESINTRSIPYRAYLFAIAFIPMPGLLVGFREVQKLYAIIGALFIPLLALALLILNGRRKWMNDYTNRMTTQFALGASLVFFGYMAFLKWGV